MGNLRMNIHDSNSIDPPDNTTNSLIYHYQTLIHYCIGNKEKK